MILIFPLFLFEASRLLIVAQSLLEGGGAGQVRVSLVRGKMIEAMQAAARECLHEGEALLTEGGDRLEAAKIFSEGANLYERIGDNEGAQHMLRRVRVAREGGSSGVCTVS